MPVSCTTFQLQSNDAVSINVINEAPTATSSISNFNVEIVFKERPYPAGLLSAKRTRAV